MTSQPDPIPQLDDEEITRIREVRHRISERFGHDPYRLVVHYIERQRHREDKFLRASEPEAASGASNPRPPRRP